MSNWKLVNKTYLYDGSFDGLLTVVFDSYQTKTLPQKIENESLYTPNFLDNTTTIVTNHEKASRVLTGINNLIGYDGVYYSYYAFLCNQKNKEINILKYLCNGFDIGPKINNMLTVSYVFQVISMQKKALSECHKLKGLLRFQEIRENLCYSSIHPTHNILEPLGHHFMKRMPNMNFIIHDKNRNLFYIYGNSSYKIIYNENAKIPEISAEERKYQELWKLFFNTIAIPERKNPRCQMQFMPKKYWQDLIEEP